MSLARRAWCTRAAAAAAELAMKCALLVTACLAVETTAAVMSKPAEPEREERRSCCSGLWPSLLSLCCAESKLARRPALAPPACERWRHM